MDDIDTSLDSTLTAAWADIQSRGGGADEEADEAPDDTLPTKDEAASAEADTTVEAPASAADAEPSGAAEAHESTKTVDEPLADEPPSSWRKTAKEAWAQLPQLARDEIRKREADFHNGIAQYKDAYDWAQTFVPMQDELMELRRQFGHETTAIKRFIELSKFSESDPAGFIQWIAHNSGVDLSQLAGGTQQPAQGAAQQQDTYARQKLATVEQQLQQFTQRQEEERQAVARQQVEAFSKQPGREYYDELKPAMARLLQSSMADTLEAAYDMALWSRGDLRAKIIAKQREEAVNAAMAEAKAKAKEARRAASTNVPKQGTLAGSAVQSESMEETLRKNAKLFGLT
jgi:hypothetical protein